jgi:catechol 2,3-dioxygenase-like lactoylglutathione lyase family enzyme
MIKAQGIHHIAVMTADIKAQIGFFSDVLGCPLVALFDMHGVPGGMHAFLQLSDDCLFSFVQLPGTGDIPIQLGVTHAGSGSGRSAPGTMQHLAFAVSTRDDLIALRPINHGMSQSIYFAGPEMLALEVAWSDGAVDPDRWIDPAVMARAGISVDEAERFRHPDDYVGEGGIVPQPPYDPAKPHVAMPEDLYRQIIAASDDMIWAISSFDAPPVPAGDA